MIEPDKTNREFAGFRRVGIFLGTESKPYVINSMTSKVSKVSIHIGHGPTPGDIVITVYDILDGASTLGAPNDVSGCSTPIPKQKLTDIQVLSGNFTHMVTDDHSSQINNIYKLLGVG